MSDTKRIHLYGKPTTRPLERNDWLVVQPQPARVSSSGFARIQGVGYSLASAELYDPATGTFAAIDAFETYIIAAIRARPKSFI